MKVRLYRITVAEKDKAISYCTYGGLEQSLGRACIAALRKASESGAVEPRVIGAEEIMDISFGLPSPAPEQPRLKRKDNEIAPGVEINEEPATDAAPVEAPKVNADGVPE